MSKSSIATSQQSKAHQNQSATQLPTRSAWSKGPPPISTAIPATSTSNVLSSPSTSSRPQSPRPNGVSTPTHSRRPSTLGPGATAVPLKEGVSVSRGIGIAGAGRNASGSSFNFGTIDNTSAPMSSSPAPAQPIPSTDASSTRSFGTLPPQNNAAASNVPAAAPPAKTTTSSTSSAASTPPAPSTPSSSAAEPAAPKKKIDIHKLFQNPSSSSPTLSPPVLNTQPTPAARRPSITETKSPASPQTRTPALPSAQPYSPYAAQQLPHMRQPPQSGGPRSPQFGRGMPPGAPPGPGTNGAGQGRGVPGLQSGPGPGAPVGSPRLGPQPIPQQSQQPPIQMQMHHPQQWQGYYPYGTEYMPPYPYWQQQPGVPPHQHMPPHFQPPHTGPPIPPSPRTPSLQNIPPPASPGLPHASPAPSQPQRHNGPSMNTNAAPFVPKQRIKITTPGGEEVNFAKVNSPRIGPADEEGGTSNGSAFSNLRVDKRPLVRMETVEMKEKRLAEEAKKEKERLQKEEAEKVRLAKIEEEKKKEEERVKREKEEKERKVQEEKERKEKEERQRIEREKREAEEQARKEEEERKKEEERKLKLEEERLRKEEEEKERLRKEEEERERLRKEEEERERLRKEEEERLRQEAEEKVRKEKEEAEARAKQEELDRLKAEEEKARKLKEEDANKTESAPYSPAPAPSTTLPPVSTLPQKPRRPTPGHLDLSLTVNKPGQPAPPSALASARIIEDLDSIKYPSGIRTPDKELNVNTANGKFRYDREFLLQFMSICKDKPDNLPPLDSIGLERDEHGSGGYGSMGRSSNRRSGSTSGMPPPSRTPSVNVGMPFNKSQIVSGGFSMGNFQPPKRPTSEDRFNASNAARAASSSFGPGGSKPPPLVRSISQGGPGGPPSPKDGQHPIRNRSTRGNKRGERPSAMSQQSNMGTPSGGSELFLEPIEPLVMSKSRWQRNASVTDGNELVERKVKALLNKLTVEKFENISNQIIDWANKSEQEKDGRTLIQVIKLVFEKATDEATWSEMYARLCRKMMEKISPNVQDDSIVNNEGKPITGGQLFRKYLLNRCQEDFERGWSQKEAAVAAAASRAADDKAKLDANTASGAKEGEGELYSEEYYAAQKAKRQGLGLVKFIGELFKLQMLTERIMHECIKKLLSNVEDPEEEEIESLCKLLTTVGGALDTQKAHNHMDIYFGRMTELSKNPNINSRMQYMLLDVIELRSRGWVARHNASANSAPTTLAQVHEQAAREKAAAEKEAANRPIGISRGGSRRGDSRRDDFQATQPGGWNVAGGGQPRLPAKAGDLSQFGKISKPSASMTFGPSSVFAGKKDGKTVQRTSSSSNMFSMLSQNASDPPSEPRTSSRPPSRKASMDLGPGGTPDSPAIGRKKLNLLPRSVPTPDVKVEEEAAPASDSESSTVATDSKAPALTEQQAKVKIDEDLKEFWNIRKIEDARQYFEEVPEEHRHLLVSALVSSALDKKADDVKLVAELFASGPSCSPESYEKGFFPSLEYIDDMAIDVPKVYPFMAQLLHGTSLPQSSVESLASKINVDGDPVVLPRDKLLKEYDALAS